MTNKTNWTQGPWECRPSAFMSDGNDKRAYFIVSGLGFSGKDDANARLIAAAPELYEALENLVGVVCGDGGTKPNAHKMAYEALAKVRGELV